MKIKDLMTKKVIVVKPSATFREVAKIFVDNCIDAAPIVNKKGKIINLITKRDIMRAFTDGLNVETKVSSIGNRNIITLSGGMDIKEICNYKYGRFPVTDDEGKIIGIISRTDFCENLRKELKEKLKHIKSANLNQIQLGAVIESSYDGIFITDGKANVLDLNNAYERITGLKKKDLLGRNMVDLEREKVISKSATLIVLKNREITTIPQEFSNGVKVLVSSNPIFDENGEIVMVVTNVRNVTQLYELKEELQKNKELTRKYVFEIQKMRKQLLNSSKIVAEDSRTFEVLQLANKVAKVDTTVLILGETGVGKDEISKYIHKYSYRSEKQFIKINCGAVPASLIESEFFGYEKGAFTGANKDGKIGLFEIASGGTIFLDEVGEIPMDLQVKLLRVLQEGEIKRIGGTKSINVDVRVIAATNRDLEEMVRNKQFREDLYYRLNVVPIVIPPLRQRKQDVVPLINHFLAHLNEKYNFSKSFSSESLKGMFEYSWPGNIRELKNIVERTVIMSEDNIIKLSDLPRSIINSKNIVLKLNHDEEITLREAVETLEEKLIEKAYSKHGNVRAAAKSLGIDAATLVRKRQKYTKKE